MSAGALGGDKREIDSLEQGLQVAKSCLMWMWGTELQYSGRLERPTNHRDHSLDPQFNDFKPGNTFILELK